MREIFKEQIKMFLKRPKKSFIKNGNDAVSYNLFIDKKVGVNISYYQSGRQRKKSLTILYRRSCMYFIIISIKKDLKSFI